MAFLLVGISLAATGQEKLDTSTVNPTYDLVATLARHRAQRLATPYLTFSDEKLHIALVSDR